MLSTKASQSSWSRGSVCGVGEGVDVNGRDCFVKEAVEEKWAERESRLGNGIFVMLSCEKTMAVEW
jgi:hypothetical protein